MISAKEVSTRARQFMNEHGLQDWHFRLNANKRRLGVCKFGPRTIEISAYLLVNKGWSEIENTIKHEVAHALAGFEAGHGPAWQAIAIRLGASPERCGASMGVDPTYFVSCVCGRQKNIPRFKRVKRGAISACCGQPFVHTFNHGAQRLKVR